MNFTDVAVIVLDPDMKISKDSTSFNNVNQMKSVLVMDQNKMRVRIIDFLMILVEFD